MSNVKKHVSTINPVGAVLDVGSADEVQWSDASDVVVVPRIFSNSARVELWTSRAFAAAILFSIMRNVLPVDSVQKSVHRT